MVNLNIKNQFQNVIKCSLLPLIKLESDTLATVVIWPVCPVNDLTHKPD